MRMILKALLALKMALMQDLMNPQGLVPSFSNREMDYFRGLENLHCTQFHKEGRLVSQTNLEFVPNLIKGDVERARGKECEVTAGLTARLGFLAKTLYKPRQGFGHIRYKGEGINAGSLPTRHIHCF